MPAHEYMAQFVRRNLVGDAPDPAGLDGRDVNTVYSIVYYTASKTFDGPAVYVTDTSDLPPAVNNAPATTHAQPTGKSSQNSITDQPTLSTAIVKQSSPSSVATTTSPSETSSINISVVASYLSLSTVPTGAAASAIISAANARSTGDPNSESASKMTSGAKAGLACGLIALVSLFLLTAWFCRKQALKKKPQNQFQQMNEKKNDKSNEKGINHDTAGAPAPTRGASNRTAKTASTAPRLSIRPITQFAPEFHGQNAGPGMHGAANPPQNPFRDPSPAKLSPWERRGAANAANDPANPFGKHAEIGNAVDPDAVDLDTPTALQTPTAAFPLMPQQNASPPVPPPHRNQNVGAATAVTGAAPAPAPAGLATGALRAAAGNDKSDMSVNSNLSGSTVATHQHPTRAGEREVPQVPPSPGPAPVGAPPSTPDSDRIHRVQLDFMPSMADELEVKVGELVRLIHAYDDGWCMCVRFDRSASGVVPRSCMSEQPVKPVLRKNGPPPVVRAPQPPRNRAPSNSSQHRPWSPVQNQGRPQTPDNFPFPNVAPLQGRSSPGPNGSPVNRPRANSHGVFTGQPGRAGPPMGRPRAPSHGAFGHPGGMSPQHRARPRTPSNGPHPGFSPNGGRSSPRGRPRGPSNASNTGANRPMSPLNPAANRGRSSSAAAYPQQLRAGPGDGPYAAAGLPMSPPVVRRRSNSDQNGSPIVREAPYNMPGPLNGQAF